MLHIKILQEAETFNPNETIQKVKIDFTDILMKHGAKKRLENQIENLMILNWTNFTRKIRK